MMGFVWQVVLFCMGIALVNSQLNCPTLPPRPVPTNINDLHPNIIFDSVKDIKVVMTLGDSITAGFGIMGRDGGVEEYRGQSWCIGGDPGAITLFNYLKYYNSSIIGGSLGHHIIEDVLNAAQSGAMVDDLAGHEMSYLVSQLKSNPNIDMQNDWKVLTLLIGANDLCGSCELSNPASEPDIYESGVMAVLEEIRTTIPRVFVNLVQVFNLSGVYTLSLQNRYCIDVHKDFAGECPCIFEPNGTTWRPMVDAITQEVNLRIENIAQVYKAKNYTDFAVVVQPFGRDTNVSSLPLDFISTLDCFHPSLLAHQALATALWNNMLTPAASKKTVLNIEDAPICPTADTLLYTD